VTSRPQFSLGIAGDNNRLAAAHAAQRGRRFQAEFPGLGRNQVGNLVSFEMTPHIFDWIEFGRIGRQSLAQQAPSRRGDVVFDQQAPMNRRAIPEDQDSPGNMPLEVPEKRDHLQAFDAAGMDLEIESPKYQAANDRKTFPVEGFVEDRGLSTRGPSARPRGAGAQSAFVDEDDGAPLLAGFFFKAGQVVRFHWRIAFSSRSTARRSGRWQLKPLAPSKRQTCPG